MTKKNIQKPRLHLSSSCLWFVESHGSRMYMATQRGKTTTAMHRQSQNATGSRHAGVAS